MFKVVNFLVLFSFAVLLIGCGSKDAAVDHSRAQEAFEGIISEMLTPIDDLDVTHVITTNDRTRVYLRSLLFDLNQYIDREVRVFGDYKVVEVLDNPVDVLTVTSIDALEIDLSTKNESDFHEHASSKFGISFNYPVNFRLNELSESILLRDNDSAALITVTPFFVSPELDLNLKLSSYNITPRTTIQKNGIQAMKIYDSTLVKAVYLDRKQLFYQIKFENFLSTEIDFFESFLNSFKFIDYSMSAVESEFDVSDVNQNSGLAATEQVYESVTNVQEFAYRDVVNAFKSRVRTLIPTYRAAVSYSFTDNGYFYFVFESNIDTTERILFRYSSDSFTEVARFNQGSMEDWQIVSGVNEVADRQLTVLLVDRDKDRSVELVPGYRYFESLPLGFGIQYPMSWYYARVTDTYIFSDAPIESSNAKIKAELVRDNFSTAPGSIISTNIKRRDFADEVFYYVKVYDTYLVISGLKEYSENLSVMANSVIEIDF